MENTKLWPCVKCTNLDIFDKEIAPRLKELGYIIKNISKDWKTYPYICTNHTGDGRLVSNHSEDCITRTYRYICSSVSEFLEATKVLAIKNGWFKEEMKWDAQCNIDELPTRLRRLAEYRKKNTTSNSSLVTPCNTVDSFAWNCTSEGYKFWLDVYYGVVSDNLEAILDKFEKEHPELLESTQEEPKQDTPTLTEARKQFRELTKHYTVEELSKNELPRDWEEYLEQRRIDQDERTAEVEKKAAALVKLVLLRDKWKQGWTPNEVDNYWGIMSTIKGVRTCSLGVLIPNLTFPTQEMANDFFNTFRDLIKEAGDLI